MSYRSIQTARACGARGDVSPRTPRSTPPTAGAAGYSRGAVAGVADAGTRAGIPSGAQGFRASTGSAGSGAAPVQPAPAGQSGAPAAVRLPEGSGESATPRPSETSASPYLHLTESGLNARLAARRAEIRRLLAAAVLRSHSLGEWDDACRVLDLSDRNYVDALVEDLVRNLRRE